MSATMELSLAVFAIFLFIWKYSIPVEASPSLQPLQFGPVHLFPPSPKRKSYSWRASVDRSLGAAFSKETSNLLPLKRSKRRTVPPSKSSNLDVVAFRTLASYPVWLCRASQSLGLLKAVQSPDGGCDVQTRWGKCSILSFHRPQGQGQLHLLSSVLPPFFAKDYTVDLPISGGAVAIADTPRGNGSLRFSIFPGRPDGAIVTQIRGYRPSIVGRRRPASPLRSRLYLGTQSLLHGFVMWRFHHHIARQLHDFDVR